MLALPSVPLWQCVYYSCNSPSGEGQKRTDKLQFTATKYFLPSKQTNKNHQQDHSVSLQRDITRVSNKVTQNISRKITEEQLSSVNGCLYIQNIRFLEHLCMEGCMQERLHRTKVYKHRLTRKKVHIYKRSICSSFYQYSINSRQIMTDTAQVKNQSSELPVIYRYSSVIKNNHAGTTTLTFYSCA